MISKLDLSFSRRAKIKSKAEFSRVFNSRNKRATRGFAVFFCANTLPVARLGIVVSKANIRRAVDRNKFKRCVRESFRTNQHLMSGKDIVVFAYRNGHALDRRELRRELFSQWLKLKNFSSGLK